MFSDQISRYSLPFRLGSAHLLPIFNTNTFTTADLTYWKTFFKFYISTFELEPYYFPLPQLCRGSFGSCRVHSAYQVDLDLASAPHYQSMVFRVDMRGPCFVCTFFECLPSSKQLSVTTRIQRQSTWYGEPLDHLLDEILGDSQDTIEVQDHSQPTLNEFTLTKTCQEVRKQFNTAIEDRGCPWNCLEIRDQLSGFKDPISLQQGGKLLHWQMTDLEDCRKNCYSYTLMDGSKAVDEWLLISEKYSGSTTHVDVAYATWISCLIGKKNFWVWNLLFEDQKIWKEFDVTDDHRFFEDPWARIDLYPGSIL